ncbi:MAG: MATE family efflux transporter [Bacillota bacterium]|nr:MATE family efflux transporter [Bacillota bacterium]
MNKEYLIQEKPMKAILVFAIPMIIGNFFQQFYTMVDSIIVGRFVSEKALAAIGASYALTNVFISIAIGGGIGASVIASLYFGERRYKEMKKSISTALLSFLTLSLILSIFGLSRSKELMILLNTPENILDMATLYLDIYFYGLPFLFMYNVLAAMFNALGRSRTPLYLLIFSSILNIVLDLYFVISLDLGIAGAAWATFIAQGISAILAFLFFIREVSSYPSKIKGFFSIREMKKSARMAFPSIIQQSTVSIGMLLVQSVVNSFGAEILAGFSAGGRVESLCIVPMAAMGNAMSTYTAQNLGAGKYQRVQEGYNSGVKIIAAFALVICIFLVFLHTPIISLFLGEDSTVLAQKTGTDFLQFIAWFFILIGLKMLTDGLLRGAGDTKIFTMANLVNLSIRVSVSALLAPVFGVAMVWYAIPMGWLANFLISYREYHKNRRKYIPATT